MCHGKNQSLSSFSILAMIPPPLLESLISIGSPLAGIEMWSGGLSQEVRTSKVHKHYLISSRYFFLSLTHAFLLPVWFYNFYDTEGTPRTLNHGHDPLSHRLPFPVLSYLINSFCSNSNGGRCDRWWMCLGGLLWVRMKHVDFDDSLTLHNVCCGHHSGPEIRILEVGKVTLTVDVPWL